ncbi:hypothetical protein [Marinomonas transparens]|nr:hypothetical protein [Marinomonas transparens]
MSEELSDLTYWLALEIAKHDPIVDFNVIYEGSLELDFLYQLLTSKAQRYWWDTFGVELNPVTINNAFFRAIAMLHQRNVEFSQSRNVAETEWVKELLHL